MKKYIVFIFVFLSVVAFSCAAHFAAASVEFNKDDIDRGIIKVKYTSTAPPEKVKVVVMFGKEQYTYNIKSSSAFVNFPLQLGNGTYQIGVYEQISGTSYSQAATTSVDLKLDDSTKVFLASHQITNWGEKMNTVTLAKELTKDKTTPTEKIEVCYQYMVQQFSYDYVKMQNVAYDYLPVIDDVLKKKLGICYDYAAVFASMLRSQGIKCKLIMGYTSNVKEYHAWNDVDVDGKWIVADTTYDSQMFANKIQYKFEKARNDYKESYEY